jgi:hypothetical protein
MFASILARALMSAEIKVRGYALPLDMRSNSGLVIYDQDVFSDNSPGKLIFETLTNAEFGIRLKSSRLPDALDMPRDVPAILVYEKLYSVPSDRPATYPVPPPMESK